MYNIGILMLSTTIFVIYKMLTEHEEENIKQIFKERINLNQTVSEA